MTFPLLRVLFSSMKNTNVRKITGVAILLAVEIVLQTLGNYIAVFGISINLALVPIAVGAIVYGPLAGAFLGLCNGAMVLASPSTQALYFQYSPLGTVATCLLKATIAGLVSGLVFKAMKNKHVRVGGIISSVMVPIINTGLFIAFCFTFMRAAIDAQASGQNIITVVFSVPVFANFGFELGSMILLSPAIVKIYKIMTRTDKHAL